ncbi:spore germination protein GerPC [Pontibacillus litoralis]|uniref:Spore germination protein GerPC n=1 Tax=Pontibacillus litoralis JSM 072002 TaxID=1385512 RepID=A0A0A5G9D7_9BACI|nr:spore germination protein GerPC [Pontibacillus litoralis]KGX87793.1 spore germination protein GerPC [Pontibacillus litoralis JSM 072002]
MNQHQAWNDYIQHLNNRVEQQAEKIKSLETRLEKLEAEMEVTQQPTSNIEKIEYKFDQLKIETLEGTLNIGFTPGNGIGIEDVSIPQQQSSPTKSNTAQSVKDNIVKELSDYLTNEGPKHLQSIARQYNKEIDATYEQFILQDIQKQLGNRVTHYMEQLSRQNDVAEEKHYRNIVEQIKQEINQSLHQFMQNKGDGNV